MKNKRRAVFGKFAGYYENPRMVYRTHKFRKGQFVRVRDEVELGSYVLPKIDSRIGSVIQPKIDPVAGVLVKFHISQRTFGFRPGEIEILNRRTLKKQRHEKNRLTRAAWNEILKELAFDLQLSERIFHYSHYGIVLCSNPECPYLGFCHGGCENKF